MPKAGWKFAVALWIGSVWNFVQGFHVESNNATPALDELLTSTTATEMDPSHRALNVNDGRRVGSVQGHSSHAAPRPYVGRHGTNVVFLNLITEEFHHKGHCFVYHGIWKCGNDAVRKSLSVAATLNPMLRFDPPPIIYMPFMERMCESVFTLATVREPLEHYISGFTEYMWRMYPRTDQVDTKTLSNIFDASLQWLADDAKFQELPPGDVSKQNNYDALHMLQMTRAIDLQTIDFLVRIERMDADWSEAMWRAKAHPFKNMHIDAKSGRHNTEEQSLTNPQNAREALRTLLISDRKRRLKLCDLLQKDYECLGYRADRCRTYSVQNAAWNEQSPDWPREEVLDSSTWNRPECYTTPLYWGGDYPGSEAEAAAAEKDAAVAAGMKISVGAAGKNSKHAKKSIRGAQKHGYGKGNTGGGRTSSKPTFLSN